MSWITNRGEHEGYVVCVFADGMVGTGGQHMKIQLQSQEGRPILNQDDPTGFWWRPPSEVIGWRIACNCTALGRRTLLDALWIRVWDPADEDLARQRIYAGPPSSDDPDYVGDREDLMPAFQRIWQDHTAPDRFLESIRRLNQDLKDLEAQLDAAVAGARTAGVSWGKIGRAVGISRQGAQKRWESASVTEAPNDGEFGERIAAEVKRGTLDSPGAEEAARLERWMRDGAPDPDSPTERWSGS